MIKKLAAIILGTLAYGMPATASEVVDELIVNLEFPATGRPHNLLLKQQQSLDLSYNMKRMDSWRDGEFCCSHLELCWREPRTCQSVEIHSESVKFPGLKFPSAGFYKLSFRAYSPTGACAEEVDVGVPNYQILVV